MEENYLKAIDLSIKMDLIKLAGLTFAEMADCFRYLKKYEHAHRYYIKSARIMQTDFFNEISLFKRIIINGNNFKNLNEPICDLFLLWQFFCKKFPKKETEDLSPSESPDEKIREKIKVFEIDFILFNLKRLLVEKELGKSILNDYDGNYKINLKTSVLNKEEFIKISDFIKAVKERNKFKANLVYVEFLVHIIDDIGKNLVKEILLYIDEIRDVRFVFIF